MQALLRRRERLQSKRVTKQLFEEAAVVGSSKFIQLFPT
jgi:hypothetical protein